VTFREAIGKRVLVFDGAMGTQIQGEHLTLSDFGGKETHGRGKITHRPPQVKAPCP